MRFRCDKQELNRALSIVSKAVSVRTTIPILKGILLEVKENGKLVLTASDMDITIENTVSVEGTEMGAVVVPARLFGDIVRKLPNDEIIFESEGENISVKCLSSEFTLVGSPIDEFPNIKNTEENLKELVFDKSIFSDMIKKTSFAASTDQTKGAITGVLVELLKDSLNMVAIDGFRMAVTSEDVINMEENKVIISARIMNEINKIITEANNDNIGDIRILCDNKSAVVYIDKIKIVMRLIAGEFLKYEDILPKESSIKVLVRKGDLAEAIERASLLSKEGKNNLIKLSIKDTLMNISSRSEEGTVNEDVLIRKEGDDLEIGFNAKYLLDILKVIDDEEIEMNFNSSISPCLIKPTEGRNYKYLILPVRITSI